MSSLPIMLIVLSCFTHASWNLLARRRQGSELAFFRGMAIASVPVSMVAIGIALCFPHSFPPTAWACVVASGAVTGFYYYFLGLAYSSADFTTVYPVARSLPVLILAGIELAQGAPPTPAGWVAMIVVVGGCILAPQVSYRGFDWKRYGRRDILWMTLTAATIVAFTKLDKIGADAINAAVGGPASAALYCAMFHITGCVSYLIILAVVGQDKTARESVGWKYPALGGVLGYMSYMLVLWAYQLAPKVSYLFAFRQLSIVVGVVLAFRVYRERGLAVRLPATAAIVVGLVVLAVWG